MQAAQSTGARADVIFGKEKRHVFCHVMKIALTFVFEAIQDTAWELWMGPQATALRTAARVLGQPASFKGLAKSYSWIRR